MTSTQIPDHFFDTETVSENSNKIIPKEGTQQLIVGGSLSSFRITAYCPCGICCGKYADGITAYGYKIKQGDKFVAANPSIPFGTKLIIPNYNDGQPVEVKDKTGMRIIDRLDVYFDTHQEALNWGVEKIEIWIVQ